MKKIIQLLFIYLIPITIFAQTNSKIDLLINSGYAKIELREFNGALDEFEQVLDLRPDHPVALCGKITVFFSRNEIKKALKMVNEAIENNSDYASFYYNRGMIYNIKKQYKKALVDFNTALEKDSSLNKHDIYLNRGVVNYNLQKYESAIDDYSVVIELYPKNAIAFHSRGLVNYELENYTKAIEDFGQSIEINVNNPVAYYNKGMAYYKIEDRENACIEFHKSCELGNRNACKMVLMECQD